MLEALDMQQNANFPQVGNHLAYLWFKSPKVKTQKIIPAYKSLCDGWNLTIHSKK
jgi:hypothetical protein